MQNMAAVQSVFKINSELHTEVSQDTKESVNKAFQAFFLLSQSQKDEGN